MHCIVFIFLALHINRTKFKRPDSDVVIQQVQNDMREKGFATRIGYLILLSACGCNQRTNFDV